MTLSNAKKLIRLRDSGLIVLDRFIVELNAEMMYSELLDQMQDIIYKSIDEVKQVNTPSMNRLIVIFNGKMISTKRMEKIRSFIELFAEVEKVYAQITTG